MTKSRRFSHLLARASVAWIPLRRHGNYDRAVPTKLVEAMAMGRPVVASDLPRMAAIVRSTGCGIVVPADDPAAHAEAIRSLLDDPDRARRMGEAGRRAFLEGLTFEREADALTAPAGSHYLFDHVASTDKRLEIYPHIHHFKIQLNQRHRKFVIVDRRQQTGRRQDISKHAKSFLPFVNIPKK